MSGPYIQFELDAAKKAALLASALGIQLREAVGGLALMWLHVYGEGKPDTVTPFFLKTFFGVDGKAAGEALVELGFLTVEDGEWRVRGADRYRALSEKRREAGKKGAAATNGKRSALAAQKSALAEQVTSHDDEAREVSNSRSTPNKGEKALKSEVDKCRGNADDSPASDEQASRQCREKGRQKSALDPRSNISLSLTGERALSNAHAHAREPDGVADWPHHAAEVAGLEWVAALTNPPARAISDAKAIALDHPAVFVAAVAHVLRIGVHQSAAPGQLRAACEGLALAGLGPRQPSGIAPPSWPGPKSEPASRRYLAAVAEHGPLTGPPATLTPHTFAELAREYGDESFTTAIDECIAKGSTWPGWRQSKPLGWIRQECERARHAAATGAKKRQAEVAPGDRYTPRYRPEPGAPAPVFERSPPNTSPEPKGAITPDATWDAVWAAAAASMKGPGYLDREEYAEGIAPLSALGVSEAGELVLAAPSPEFRQTTLDELWDSFVVPAVERELARRKLPQSPLRITAQGTKARGAA